MTKSAPINRLLVTAVFTLGSTAHAEEAPNPAAVFCSEQGGSYRSVQEVEGERGVCVLRDSQEVDAWSYFRDHHSSQPAGKTPTAEAIHTQGESMSGKTLTGGWTRQDVVGDDAQSALAWVLAQMNTAAGLQAVRGVWTQVVAGLNYAIEFELDNGEVWHTVVFRDLEGEFHLTQPAQLGPRPDPYRRKD